MDKRFIERCEQRLCRLLAETWRDEEGLEREAQDERDHRDHVSDWMTGEDVTLDLMDRKERVRVQVIDALERIDDGTYGRCTGCGDPIRRARLEAIPYAETCIDCARGGRSALRTADGWSGASYLRNRRREGRKRARHEASVLHNADPEHADRGLESEVSS